MVDEVFQQVRIGRHVDATAPLARWLRDADGEIAARDSLYVAGRALRWESLPALNPIASTLVRHLLRAGRPDVALEVFELLRTGSALLTMDSANDLRTLADYAQSIGREALAASLRLETPVHRPGT
jgi:pentatricopeptide repeat protein